MTAYTTGVNGERNDLLEVDHVLNVGLGLGKLHAHDRVRNLAHVLVVHPEGGAARFGR